MPILNQRAILLVKAETTAGVDAVPTVLSDAIYIISPEVGVDVKFMERKFARRDFSRYQAIAGRKLATLKFGVEVAHTGTATVAPRWSRLFQGCSMAGGTQTTVSRTLATGALGATRASNVTTFATAASHGFSIGNIVSVTGNTDSTYNGTFTIVSIPSITSFTVANVGTSGNSSNSSGAAALIAGTLFSPITDNQQTLTLYIYYDGLLHKMTGCMGTFSLMTDSGNLPELMFTFQGIWSDPVNTGSFPTGDTYDTVINPPIMEYASMVFNGDASLVANIFKFDLMNKLVERQDMNAKSGFRSIRISERAPTGNLDPDTELTQTFWQNMTNTVLGSMTVTMGGTISGITAGLSMVFSAPSVQIMKNVYKDRDNLRVYDLTLDFRRGSLAGNDEFSWLFT